MTTRLVMIAILSAICALLVLGVVFIKDSYRILPLGASKEGQAGPFTEWRNFDSQKFNVMLPAVPQNATQNITDPKTKEVRHYDMFIAQKSNGAMFMISLITFKGTSPDTLQKTVINDLLASNPQNQLKDMKVGSFQDSKSIEFKIGNPDTTVKGVTFVVGNTLYLLTAVFPNQVYSDADYDYFIKSFHLNK